MPAEDELGNSVLVVTSTTVIISLFLSPCCCYILLKHTAFYIHIVFRVNAYSRWKPDLKVGGLNLILICIF